MPLELVRLHQSGNFYVRITAVGSGRLPVNATHLLVPATDSQSLISWLNASLLYLCKNLRDFCLISRMLGAKS